MAVICIKRLEEFDTAFGSLGAKVGSRTGSNKRTQDEKEWFVLRQFMKRALAKEIFDLPIVFEKVYPPRPDFAVKYGEADKPAMIEITEATHPDDQREMTESEKSDKSATLLGEFGGRFADGASQPKFAWVSDILDAVVRKQKKPICSALAGERHLIVYPNSNASLLLFDEEDEREAFIHLQSSISEMPSDFVQALNGCRAHVLGKELLGVDIFERFRLIRRDVS